MSTVKSFTVGSVTINASMPSALEQDEILSLMSAEIIHRAAIAARSEIEMGEQLLTTMFMSMNIIVKRRVADVLLSKALIAGTNTRVSVADFGGRMVEYNKLLAQLTLWNYEDFFTYLSDAVNVAQTEQQAPVV